MLQRSRARQRRSVASSSHILPARHPGEDGQSTYERVRRSPCSPLCREQLAHSARTPVVAFEDVAHPRWQPDMRQKCKRPRVPKRPRPLRWGMRLCDPIPDLQRSYEIVDQVAPGHCTRASWECARADQSPRDQTAFWPCAGAFSPLSPRLRPPSAMASTGSTSGPRATSESSPSS